MALVTEARLREEFPDPEEVTISRYEVPEGTLVTPAARGWLIDHKIDLKIGSKVIFATPRTGTDSRSASAGPTPPMLGSPDGAPAPVGCPPAGRDRKAELGPIGEVDIEPVSHEGGSVPATSALPTFVPPEHFDVIDGTQIESKPEYLTALRGNLLVAKNHPEIKFRGRLDSLEADLLILQVEFRKLGLPKGVEELGEVLRYVKEILRCEVLEVPFEHVSLFGLDDEELRHRSHYPQQYYGIPHFATSVDDGAAVVLLNQLRTKVREVELAAYDAYTAGGVKEPTRVDLIRALNRLSSAVYLMMFQAKTKELE